MFQLIDKVKEGGSYAIKNYTCKNGTILFNRSSQFFATAAIQASSEKEAEAKSLLNPPSMVISLTEKIQGKLVTVEGVIKEVSSKVLYCMHCKTAI